MNTPIIVYDKDFKFRLSLWDHDALSGEAVEYPTPVTLTGYLGATSTSATAIDPSLEVSCTLVPDTNNVYLGVIPAAAISAATLSAYLEKSVFLLVKSGANILGFQRYTVKATEPLTPP